MKRPLFLTALLGTLFLVGCSTATPSARQPLAPPVQVPAVAASSTARSSDAAPLGMSQTELRTEISEGKSIKDILKSRGVDVPEDDR